MAEHSVNEDILEQPTTPVMEMDHIVIKEEHHDNFFVENQSWDIVQVKQEPKTEITIDDNSLQLPQEMPRFSLTESAPHEAFKEDPDGTQSEVLHNTASPDSGMQLSLNVKPSSLPDCEKPSVHQHFRDTLKERLLKKTQTTSTMLFMGVHMRKNETIEENKPVLQHQIFNTTEKSATFDTVKTYTCEICQKCFSTPCSLKRHIGGLHTGSKPYTCDACHKCFIDQSALKRHRRIHTGSKPYTCDACNKCFIELSALKRHRLIHTGSKPYTCDTCNKCFRELSTLTTHIRIHTGSKPYTCEICLQCFTTRSALKKHVRLHTGSKPYSCDTCHKCFSDLSNLKKHIRSHTGSKPYICETCNKCFSQVYTLKRHIRIHTKE